MQSTIRIIKSGAERNTNGRSVHESDKTDQQRERETTNTVKSWIAEWEARNRAVKAAAFALLGSLENKSEDSTRPFAVVNA